MDKISLIIPTKNNSENLNTLLSSIENWTLFPNQIIIIDSGFGFIDDLLNLYQ